MLNLDPGKLIVIAVVAIILLGPDKLPQFARQMGGAWRSFNDFRHRMESEVRSNMPDLPPSSEIARLARSPSALLTHLSTMSDSDKEDAEGEAPDGSYEPPAGVNGSGDAAGSGSEAGAGLVTGAGAATGSVASNGASTDGLGTDGAAPAPTPARNGRPDVASQPTEVAVPADPTLN
jgi:sec-independent protein translocase protein TatB